MPVPGFENLAVNSVPIPCVGTAGGFGKAGHHALLLEGSDDVSLFTIQRLPDRKRGDDVGHGDLLTAREADAMAWEPILDWTLTR